MANDYINKITATDGTTYDIKDTVSGYTTNTGTVTGMTTTAGSHTAGAQTVTNGIITTNIPTKTSHLTNDSGFITTDSDEKLKIGAVANNTTNTTYYPILATNSTAAATRYYDSTGIHYNNVNGSTTVVGKADLVLGNSTASGSANNKKGTISLYSSTSNYGYFTTADLTAQRTYTFPDETGTVALTSDIPSIPTVPTITLNGTATTSPSFYAPTTAGTSGYVLKSNGSGAPTWTSATLTDTQVTSTAVTATSTYYLTGSSSSTTATGGLNKHASISAYVDADTSTTGLSRINLGNNTATGTAGAKQGVLRLYGNTAYYCDIRAEGSTPTANRTIYLPSYDGTMYLPCMSTTSAVGSANNPVYVEATGRIVAGNSFVPTTGGTFSGAVTAAASDGTTAQIANIKYGSAAPSGTATTGTVYFQTGSSAYTFQSRVNLTGLTANTTLSNWTSFTLSKGLYLITFQVNCGSISTYNLRIDLIAGSNTITQIRSGTGSNATGMILDGAGLIECTSSTTIYFKAQTSSSSISNGELHYSYVKLF